MTKLKILIITFFFSNLSYAGVLDTEAKSLAGDSVKLSKFRGKTVLFVNTASKCGYTPQFKGLEALYKKYKSKGFVVLGFPSDDFNQEDLSDEKIKNFCKINYGVSFPMFSKSSVTGDNINEAYKEIFKELKGEKINWNFEKILVNKKGKVFKKYSSSEKPLDGDLEKDVVKNLKQKS